MACALLTSVRMSAALVANPSPRIEFQVAIGAESTHNFFSGFRRSIADGGLFIATQAVAPVGSEVLVRCALPGHDAPIVAEAIVRWVREVGEPESFGIGVCFAALAPADQAAIDAFMNQRDPIFHVNS
jgi:uncharacterized protein (TIGR02266 family)